MIENEYKNVMKNLIDKFNLTDSEALKLYEVPRLILSRFPYRFTATDDGKFLIYAEFYRIDKSVRARIRSQLDVINGGKALEELNEKAVNFLRKCVDKGIAIPAPDDEFDILEMIDKDAPTIPEDPFDPFDETNAHEPPFEDDDSSRYDEDKFFDKTPGVEIDDIFNDDD